MSPSNLVDIVALVKASLNLDVHAMPYHLAFWLPSKLAYLESGARRVVT
jgi:hypothetical protein